VAHRASNPADVGLPTEDDGSRNHPLLGPHTVYVSRYKPDFQSLRGHPRGSSSRAASSQTARSPTRPRWP